MDACPPLQNACPSLAPGVQSLVGGKYLKLLQKHMGRLRRAYDHGNRKLFYDDLVSAYLLAFFNPVLRTLRSIEDHSQLPQTQEHLRVRKLCRSTMSDANALMDARLLEPLLARLRQEVPDLKHRDGPLSRLLSAVQVVDGSFFAAAADVTWAIRKRGGKGPPADAGKPRERGEHFKARLDLHLDGQLLPRRLVVCGKECSEADSAAQRVDPQAIYIVDRGYVDLDYIQRVLAGSADLVLRLKQDTNFTARGEQPLDPEDRKAGVLHDRIGQLSGSPHTRRRLPGQELREVVVFDPDHPDKPIRLLSSLLDLPAHVIALLYRWRWQIELFFRWLKVHAHFRHLISHSRNGMTLGFYVAVIAVLLIYLHSGRPMSKYAYNLLAAVAAGWGSIEDILPILEAREKERERDRQRQARRRAEKTAH